MLDGGGTLPAGGRAHSEGINPLWILHTFLTLGEYVLGMLVDHRCGGGLFGLYLFVAYVWRLLTGRLRRAFLDQLEFGVDVRNLGCLSMLVKEKFVSCWCVRKDNLKSCKRAFREGSLFRVVG